MFFEGARGENLLDLRQREINLFIRVVEMRREADAGLGAIVHQDLAGDQLAHHLRRVGAINGDGAGAFGGVHGRVDAPAAGLRASNHARRLAHGLFADGPDADLIENFQAGLAGVERRDVRGAIEITEGIIAAINRAGFEIERALMREPPRKRGLAFGAQVGADVKIADPRSAAEPLENSADGEIAAEHAHINGDGAGGLKEIEDDVGADAVSAFDDGAGIDDGGAAEEHQGNGDEKSVLVNRGENFFERDADAVLTGNGFDAGAETGLFVVEILDGGKFEVHQDDFVARATEIETGTDNGLDDGDVLMERAAARFRSIRTSPSSRPLSVPVSISVARATKSSWWTSNFPPSSISTTNKPVSAPASKPFPVRTASASRSKKFSPRLTRTLFSSPFPWCSSAAPPSSMPAPSSNALTASAPTSSSISFKPPAPSPLMCACSAAISPSAEFSSGSAADRGSAIFTSAPTCAPNASPRLRGGSRISARSISKPARLIAAMIPSVISMAPRTSRRSTPASPAWKFSMRSASGPSAKSPCARRRA